MSWELLLQVPISFSFIVSPICWFKPQFCKLFLNVLQNPVFSTVGKQTSAGHLAFLKLLQGRKIYPSLYNFIVFLLTPPVFVSEVPQSRKVIDSGNEKPVNLKFH